MSTAIDSPSLGHRRTRRDPPRLAETSDLAQIKDFRDQAEAVRHYAKTAALGLEMQNQAAEAKLVAERRAGEVLEEMRSTAATARPDAGTTRGWRTWGSQDQSSRWQREASVPEEDFDEYLRLTREEGKELTSRGLLRLARADARETGKPARTSSVGLGRSSEAGQAAVAVRLHPCHPSLA